jgi:intracellular sulfur oxidation DsrE/DsrF family protein
VTKRTPDVFEGEAVDTELVVPRLTEYERQRVKEAKAASAEALGRDAAEIRTQHDRTLAERISTKSGLPIISASRLVAARHRGVLLPHLDLDFDHLGIVSVAAVLADPDRFIGETLADPLEGADYGRCKAKVMRGDDGLFIHSFAHGRAIYLLRRDARSAKAAIAQAPVDGLIDYAMATLTTTEMEDDELADLAATVAKAAGIGVRAVMARIVRNVGNGKRPSARRPWLREVTDASSDLARHPMESWCQPRRFSMRFSRPTSGRNPQCGTHRATWSWYGCGNRGRSTY